MNTSFLFALGAKDPEMDAIEALLQSHGVDYIHASKDGRRCHPGNAYQADPVVTKEDFTLVAVECGGVGEIIRCDHHNPGDSGFGRGSSEYWEASSIGQVYKLLGLEPTQTARVVAAFDHNLADAYAGFCEGVSPEEVRALAIQEIASGTKASVEAVEQAIVHYHAVMMVAPVGVVDLTSKHMGDGYTVDLLAAKQAGCITNRAYQILCSMGGKDQVMLNAANPQQVAEFAVSWEGKCEKMIANPTRGFAIAIAPKNNLT